MTNAVPREYIYPDINNRQQNILTRSTPAYHAPVITAGITQPQRHQLPHTMGQSYLANTQAGHPVFTAQQQTQTMISQPWTTIGAPGAPYQTPAGAPVRYTTVPTENNSVRFSMADDIQTPRIPAGNTERTRHRAEDNAQHSSDNN